MIYNISETEYPRWVEAVRERNSAKAPRAFVQSFGCQQNEADSERIRGICLDMGYSLTDDPSAADLILINTCAVRNHAEVKIFSLLGNFKERKAEKPDLIIGVVGCMAAESSVAERLKRSFKYVTFTLEPNMLHLLPKKIYSYLCEKERTFTVGEDKGDIVEGLPVYRMGGKRAWVSIMYGCNNFCSYCIVPYVRGRERSRSSSEVIEECRGLISEGVREITLLGQNVNSYKSDMTFAELLEKIASIDGDFILRFMTSHPKDASDELIDVMRRCRGKVAPYFHLPMQSGSDPILKRMNRTYNMERYLSVVKKLREAVPGIALSTDVIVGFPGETDEDFKATMDILKLVEFDLVYSFIYSKRDGTKAASFEDQIPRDISGERMNELLEVQRDISKKKNVEYIGKRVRVLVEGPSKRGEENIYTARTDTNKLVHFSSDIDKTGEFVWVKIERAGAFDLFAKEISEE